MADEKLLKIAQRARSDEDFETLVRACRRRGITGREPEPEPEPEPKPLEGLLASLLPPQGQWFDSIRPRRPVTRTRIQNLTNEALCFRVRLGEGVSRTINLEEGRVVTFDNVDATQQADISDLLASEQIAVTVVLLERRTRVVARNTCTGFLRVNRADRGPVYINPNEDVTFWLEPGELMPEDLQRHVFEGLATVTITGPEDL